MKTEDILDSTCGDLLTGQNSTKGDITRDKTLFTPNLWEVCGDVSPSVGHTWNNIYASLALGLRVVTDRLLVLPCTGGGCSTIPGRKAKFVT